MSKKFILRGKIFLLDIIDFVSFFVFITGIILFIRFFIINPYTVVGASMSPTFSERDFIIVDKITPRRGSLQRGDIIVFVPQGKQLPFIKRVIGLPGEIVRIIEGRVYICDTEDICFELNEPYLSQENRYTKAWCGKDVFHVDSSSYFVLGDNRGHSTDSRCCFGFACYEGANYLVYPEDIIGKVFVRVYPHFSSFQSYQYETGGVQQVLGGDQKSEVHEDDAILQGLDNR